MFLSTQMKGIIFTKILILLCRILIEFLYSKEWARDPEHAWERPILSCWSLKSVLGGRNHYLISKNEEMEGQRFLYHSLTITQMKEIDSKLSSDMWTFFFACTKNLTQGCSCTELHPQPFYLFLRQVLANCWDWPHTWNFSVSAPR